MTQTNKSHPKSIQLKIVFSHLGPSHELDLLRHGTVSRVLPHWAFRWSYLDNRELRQIYSTCLLDVLDSVQCCARGLEVFLPPRVEGGTVVYSPMCNEHPRTRTSLSLLGINLAFFHQSKLSIKHPASSLSLFKQTCDGAVWTCLFGHSPECCES